VEDDGCCKKHEFNFGILAHYDRAAERLSHTGIFLLNKHNKKNKKNDLSLPSNRTLYCRDAAIFGDDRYVAVVVDRLFDLRFVAVWDVLDVESGPFHAFEVRKKRTPVFGSMSGSRDLVAFCVCGRKFVRMLVYHAFKGKCILSLSLGKLDGRQSCTTAISPTGKWVAVSIDGVNVLVGEIEEIRRDLLKTRSFRMRRLVLKNYSGGEEIKELDFCFLADRCLQVLFSSFDGRARVLQIVL